MKYLAAIVCTLLTIESVHADLGDFLYRSYAGLMMFSDKQNKLPTQSEAIKQLQELIGEGTLDEITARLKKHGMSPQLKKDNVSEQLKNYGLPEDLIAKTSSYLFVEGPHIQREGIWAQSIDFFVYFDSDDRFIEWRYLVYSLAL